MTAPMATQPATTTQREVYTRIIDRGEAALARNGANAPMAKVISDNVAWARRMLAELGA